MINISLSDVQEAQKRIAPFIKKTPFKRSDYFSDKIGKDIFLKWESEQEIKSFKVRGALNKILSLTEEEKKQGLIASSAGNHAQGVSLAARYADTKVRVVMMETASEVKIEATKQLGAEVILKGSTYDECYAYARSIQGDSIFIHPYADSFIMAGQGTVALEIFEEQPDIDTLVFAIGGGGLIGGCSVVAKTLQPDCNIYGTVWEGTSGFCRTYHNIKSDQPCLCDQTQKNQISKSGLTDGIAVKNLKPEMFDFISPSIKSMACISEKEISQIIVEIFKAEKKIVEGSGVAALTALMKYKDEWSLGNKIAVVISGGNIDQNFLKEVMAQHD